MRLSVWFLCLFLTLNSISCKKSNQNSDESSTSKVSYPIVEDWSKAYNFKKLNPDDKEKKFQLIDNYFKTVWLPANVSGGLIVAQHGQIIYEAYNGFEDIENQIPMTAESSLHIASISKIMTALVILKYADEGKINLNDKVSLYLENFPYSDVSIENLLNHRSALPNYLYLSDDKAYWDNSQMMSNQDVLDMLVTKKPAVNGTAGKNFSYNNTNFVLLALIIEKLSGMTYPEAMKKMIFDPIGMDHTFVMDFDKDADRVSKSYNFRGSFWAYDHLDKTYGDKNIYSTPGDLLKLDLALYSDKILSDKMKELAWKGYSYEKKGVKNYGLGFRMMEWDNGDKMLYHTGKWHGNNSVLIHDVKNEVSIISIGNRRSRLIYDAMSLISYFSDYPMGIPGGKNPDNSLRLGKNNSKTDNSEEGSAD